MLSALLFPSLHLSISLRKVQHFLSGFAIFIFWTDADFSMSHTPPGPWEIYPIVHGVAVILSLKEVTGHHFTSKTMQKAWKCLRSLFYSLLDVVHGPREEMWCCTCLGMPLVVNCRDWAMMSLLHHVVHVQMISCGIWWCKAHESMFPLTIQGNDTFLNPRKSKRPLITCKPYTGTAERFKPALVTYLSLEKPPIPFLHL